MRFNQHYNLEGRHAFLAPSSPAWVNYDDEKMGKSYFTSQAAKRGDRLHALAAEAISLAIKLPEVSKTMNMYVNDAIGWRMVPEQLLYFSEFCFGTADCMSFREPEKMLRISDLKTGTTRTSMAQLEIYAALFCLEYGYTPFDLVIELRIYKGDRVELHIPDPTQIVFIMSRIKTADKIFRDIQGELADV